jgi:hypothetical protein
MARANLRKLKVVNSDNEKGQKLIVDAINKFEEKAEIATRKANELDGKQIERNREFRSQMK